MADESTTPTTPAEEVLAVELPEDLRPQPPEGAPPTPAPSEAEPRLAAEEPGEPDTPASESPRPVAGRPRGMVPKQALDDERRKRRVYQGRYEEAERAREYWQQESVRLRREQQMVDERARRDAELKPVNYDALPDLQHVGAEIERRARAHAEAVRADLRRDFEEREREYARRLLHQAEKAFKREHPDYDKILRDAGVTDAVTIVVDPATGQQHPRDPGLHRYIFSAPDPAEAAYEYAMGKLASQREGEAELRGERRARRETVEQLHAAADRPRGISALPSSSATTTSGISRRQIHAMTDEQKLRLKRERPEVWEWYLEGAGT